MSEPNLPRSLVFLDPIQKPLCTAYIQVTLISIASDAIIVNDLGFFAGRYTHTADGASQIRIGTGKLSGNSLCSCRKEVAVSPVQGHQSVSHFESDEWRGLTGGDRPRLIFYFQKEHITKVGWTVGLEAPQFSRYV